MHKAQIDTAIVAALKRVNGIVDAVVLMDANLNEIRAIEKQAEKRSLMGLGRVTNTGIYDVLACTHTFVALTSLDFNWGCHPALILKKDDRVVGTEIHDPDRIAELSQQSNVWFLHDNFIIYKDRLTFPQDLMTPSCWFDIPCLPADWCSLPSKCPRPQSRIWANPAAPCDLFLKKRYFGGIAQKGVGTILVGIQFENGH